MSEYLKTILLQTTLSALEQQCKCELDYGKRNRKGHTKNKTKDSVNTIFVDYRIARLFPTGNYAFKDHSIRRRKEATDKNNGDTHRYRHTNKTTTWQNNTGSLLANIKKKKTNKMSDMDDFVSGGHIFCITNNNNNKIKKRNEM